MTSPVTANGAHEGHAVTGSASTPVSGGVRIERLRAATSGKCSEKLFMVPGLEADPDELNSIVSAFAGPQEVFALAPILESTSADADVTVERIAERMVAALLDAYPSPTYRLAGYSFGGLIALEVAQQLRAAGRSVAALFLIDAVYDERFWARGIWLVALARRTRTQVLRIIRMRPDRAIVETRQRGARLVRRLARRRAEHGTAVSSMAPDDSSVVAERARVALASYRPRFYPGSLTLIVPSIDSHFGCDTADLWTDLAEHVEIQRVHGDHLTMAQEPQSVAAVAQAIDHSLARERADWRGVRPMPGFERPMILTTMRWFSGARLGHALIEAGFAVSACRPNGHVLDLVDGLTSDNTLHKFWPARSLIAAIRRANPDIILADDEQALALLRRLYMRLRATDPDLAAVVARSLGNIDDWPSIASRAALAREARALNIAAPHTVMIENVAQLDEWVSAQGLPTVLKTDGSWGGRGVAIIRDGARTADVWRSISNAPKLTRALKRLVFDFETGSLLAWARQSRPVVNAQEYVEGREAIVTVACLDGAVEALVCLEVVQASEPRGPATVVRIIDHPAMAQAARALVARYGLSGFCGFDFILGDSGEAQLLELNPRVTPTCHLLVEGDYGRSRTIALFPKELIREAESGTPIASELDVPVRAPALIERGNQLVARDQRLIARLLHGAEQRFSSTRY